MSAPPPPNPDSQVTKDVRTISDMPASTTNNPSDNSPQELSEQPRATSVDEVLIIPDQMMVFRSNEASAPLQVSKKMPSKAPRAKFKKREDTPAPSTKGDGRKRLDGSPFPEDKQICKRLDFGSESYPTTGEVNVPDSGRTAGVEAADDEVEKGDAPAGTKGPLVGELVNLPEMAMETKPILESVLAPCQVGESHEELAVSHLMQPKGDILLLANLDSADMLDTMAAQPLLAGGQPEIDQMVVALYTEPPPAPEEPMLTLMTTSSSLDVMPNAPAAKPVPTGGLPEEGQLAAVPRLEQMPKPTRPLDTVATFVPSYEEFPPLVKGRTLKLRDSFEAGKLHHGSGSVWPKAGSAGQEPRDMVGLEAETVLVSPAGIQAPDGSGPSNLDGSRHANKPGPSKERPKETPSAAIAKENVTKRDPITLGSSTPNMIGAGTSPVVRPGQI